MQQSYTDRLAGLRRALSVALSDAQHTVARGYCDSEEEGAELAFVNLWDATLKALIDHADCNHHEILDIVAGTLQLGLPVPIMGTIEQGVVHMDTEWMKHWRGLQP